MTSTDSSQWSLDCELQKVAEVDGIATALHALGLISRPQSSYRLLGGDGEWVRGGAETYIFRFQVDEKGKGLKDVIIKACVAFALGANLSDILEQWIQRRKLLRANGVETPHLYGSGHGVLIEEYIPHSLPEVLCSATSSRKELLAGLAIYAAALSRLGFAPIGPFHDLRSRGRDVVAIDFGEDLGPAWVKNERRPEIFEKLAAYMRELGVNLSDTETNELRAIFAAHESELLH
jgi:hypothetical protein